MILTLNCGSQSVVIKSFKDGKEIDKFSLKDLNDDNYKPKLKNKLEELGKKYEGVVAVGHRVVHGGDEFNSTTILDEEKIKKLEKYNYLAPLHNPNNLLGIKIAKKVFSDAKQVAVFDTQFYSNLPSKAREYALPKEIREKYGFKRFGFHGISHEYTAKKAAKQVGISFESAKIISAHLGGGCSVAAIKNGEAIDTSMGHTPLEGLAMMTRSGDVDPGVVLELAKNEGIEKTDNLLNKKSGMVGLAGTQNMLKVIKDAESGDEKAALALNVFTYRVKKYISAYYGVLGGADIICFTGSIGNGHPKTREMILDGLPFSGEIEVVKIEPNEELAIYEKVKKIV
ncbi:MAG: acetate/propionate family kinase [Patescibacteria group bacterium]